MSGEARASSGAVTEDRILGGRVLLRQPARGYRVAIDPVLLAAAVPAVAGQMVLDVGCGVGAAALCLAARVEGVRVVGLDSDPAAIDLANANAAQNKMAGRVRFVVGDVAAPPVDLVPGLFDRVMTNPPFGAPSGGTPSPSGPKRRATVEGATGIEEWLRFCRRMAKPDGAVVAIHRWDRRDEVIAALDGTAPVLLPLVPNASGKPPKRFVVTATLGRAAAPRILPPAVLHNPDGTYTDAIEAVLRHAGPLVFDPEAGPPGSGG